MFTNEKQNVICSLGGTGQDDSRFKREVNYVLLDFCQGVI